jgi:hypothetical protein
MLLDSILAFSTDQLVTTTADCENSPIDTEIVSPDFGKGQEIGVMFIVKTSFANATSMSFDIYHGLTSADTLLISSGAIAEATLVAGFTLFIPLPKSVRRYLKVTYTVDGSHNAGAIDAFLTVKQ